MEGRDASGAGERRRALLRTDRARRAQAGRAVGLLHAAGAAGHADLRGGRMGSYAFPRGDGSHGSPPDPAYPLEPVLRLYGLEAEPDGRDWSKAVRCPFHGDAHPSAVINWQRQYFHCFACEAKGGAVQLIMHKEGLDRGAAVTRVEDLLRAG